MKLTSTIPVAVWVSSLFLSTVTLTWGAAMEFAMPGPETTGQWSFYGVLICAIIVLFFCLGLVLRWVATTWLQRQEKSDNILMSLKDSIDRNTDASNKSIQWFEKVAQTFVQHGLETAHMSMHTHKEDRR